jgi:hypothetical protein
METLERIFERVKTPVLIFGCMYFLIHLIVYLKGLIR